MMRTIVDRGAMALWVVMLAAPGGAIAAEPVPELRPAAAAEAEVDDLVPLVKVEIQHRGAVMKSKPARLDWGEAGSIRLERGERRHDVTVAVTREDGDTKRLHVTVSYELDGELVIDEFAYDTKAKKREVLRTDGVALALTVTPTPLPDDGPQGREDKLDPPVDETDPLGGL